MQLCHKFDIAYFTAIEKISFRMYPRLCELEAQHGVDIGKSYANEQVSSQNKIKEGWWFSIVVVLTHSLDHIK